MLLPRGASAASWSIRPVLPFSRPGCSLGPRRCRNDAFDQASCRNGFLYSQFGPARFLVLCSVLLERFGLIFGFALLHWALETVLHSPDETTRIVYLSLYGRQGHFLPHPGALETSHRSTTWDALLTVVESGLGFGFSSRHGDRLSTGPVPGVFAPRGHDRVASRCESRLASTSAGQLFRSDSLDTATSTAFDRFSRGVGAAGSPKSWKVTSRSPLPEFLPFAA